MRVRVDIPVRLVVEPGALRGDALVDLERQVTELLREKWLYAQGELQSDGFGGRPELGPTSIEWSGPGRRAFSEPERRAVEKRLRAVVHNATPHVLPATEDSVRAWRVHPRIDFRVRFVDFVQLVRNWWYTKYPHQLYERTGEHYFDEVPASAWVVDVTRAVPLPELHDGLATARIATHGSGPYLLFRDRGTARSLRALAPHALAALPALHSDEPVYPQGTQERDTVIPAGVRLIFVAAAEPPPSAVPVVEFEAPYEVAVTWADLAAIGFVDRKALLQRYPAVDWPRFDAMYPDWAITIRVQPFAINRDAYDDVVRDRVIARASQGARLATLVGKIFHVGRDDVATLPAPIASRVTAQSVPQLASRDASAPAWRAGDRGLVATPVLDDIAERIYVVNHHDVLLREARELAHIVLEVEDSHFFGAHRLEAFERFFWDWRVERPKRAMEILFGELDRLGAFTELFEILAKNYALWRWIHRAVIANVTGTSFEHRAEVQTLVAVLNEASREYRMQLSWERDTTDLVFVHSGAHVVPAGTNNPDPNAGVIAEVEEYFSSGAVVSRPTKATLDRLKGPTRKKLGDLMTAMMCKDGETRTREQLIQEAINAAAAELKLTEDDFERVKLHLSYRVIEVVKTPEHGLTAVYVTIQPVRRFANDKDWESAGEPKRILLSQLDAEMESLHVDHLVKALTTFMIAEALVIGIAVAIAAGAIIEVLLAITFRELMYILETPAAERDLDGFLTAALYGVVDGLGFKLGSALTAKLVGRVVTTKLLQAAATKWILYAAKGIAASTTLGVTQVVEKFTDDLFHLSHCRRWSSPLAYLAEFGKGFAMGLVCEFAVAPFLSITARAAIRALANRFGATAAEAAEALVQHIPVSQLEGTLENGARNLEQALANTAKDATAGVMRRTMAALRQYIQEVVEHARTLPEPKGVLAKLRNEWTSRAVKELFEAAEVASKGEVKLGTQALTAIDRLVRTTSTEDMNAILETLLRAPRLRSFLDASPKIGEQLLTRAFRAGPDELELFLGHLRAFSADDAASILASLLRVPRLSAMELNMFGQLVEKAPAELAAFMKVAELDELRALLRLAARNPVDHAAVADMLRLGAARPQAFNDVLARLELQLKAGTSIDGTAVREVIARSDHAAEEEALRIRQRLARKSVTPEQASKSIDKDVRFGERKDELPKLTEDPKRVAADLEQARIERERYEIMKNGDPARGGERRPLAFTSWEDYDKFKAEFAALVKQLAKGKEITSQGQVIGSSTSFYSGNPDKPLGHYYDRKAPAKMGDVDVDLYAPDLVKEMLASGVPTMNEKVLVGGERTIFRNSGPGGVAERFPDIVEFNERWSEILGREVDVKLRVDLDLPPKPKTGPIEFFRKEAP